MDRITAARVFVETVDRGSTAAAATALGMSRAMASRYLGALEDWTGTRLLHRTTRRLSLTSAGESVLELSREMIGLADSIEVIAAQSETPHGLLRIAAPTILAEARLVDLLGAFLTRYPRLSIELQATDRTVDLVEDRIDVAVRIAGQLDPMLITRRLGSCASILCASPKYLRQHRPPAHPNDLSGHLCLTYTQFGQSEWRLSRDAERVAVSVSGQFRTNDTLALRRGALSGLGIAMLPVFAVAPHVSSGELEIVLPGWEPEAMPINALYASRRHLTVAARAFIDFLVERLSHV